MPRSSTTYLRRAWLRSSRLPKSRKTVTMASTTSGSSVSGTQARGSARRGKVVGSVALRPRPPPASTTAPSVPSGPGASTRPTSWV